MATLPNTTRWLRRAAFASGLVAAATLAAIGRIPAGTAPFALDATVTTGQTGELRVAPAGRVAAATALAPGKGTLHGRVAVQNITAAPVAVRVRMRPSISDADQALQVRVTGPDGVLYSGPAGGLRRPSPRALAIASQKTTTLDVTGWVSPSAGNGWRGRNVTLPLEYVTSIRGKVRR
jgi:hypothetical protein